MGNAQSLGIGASINHIGNGLNVFYSDYLDNSKKWGYDAGLRIHVNTFSINNNRSNYLAYQTGYAHDVLEYFGVNFKIYRSILSYRNLSLEGQFNVFGGYLSKLYLSHNLFDGFTRTVLWQPAFVVEGTLGLQLQYKINPIYTISFSSGVGYTYQDHHYQKGYDIYNHIPVMVLLPGKKNKVKGLTEFIGLASLPTMSLSLKRKF